MNFLAHCYLAEESDEGILGNLLGDFVKGRFEGVFSPAVERGITLHRSIDVWTDEHPSARKARALLPDSLGRWKGALLDIYFDHLLARNWHRWSSIPLREFTASVTKTLQSWDHSVLPKAEPSVRYIIENDLLYSYRTVEGIASVFRGMGQRVARRIGSNQPLDFPLDGFLDADTELESAFSVLLVDLRHKVHLNDGVRTHWHL